MQKLKGFIVIRSPKKLVTSIALNVGANGQYGITANEKNTKKIRKVIEKSAKTHIRLWLQEIHSKATIEEIYNEIDKDNVSPCYCGGICLYFLLLQSGTLEKEEFLKGFRVVVGERCGEEQVERLRQIVVRDTERDILEIYNSIVFENGS